MQVRGEEKGQKREKKKRTLGLVNVVRRGKRRADKGNRKRVGEDRNDLVAGKPESLTRGGFL